MPVIIREEREILGKKYKNVIVYKSDKPITKEAKEQAQRLDQLIETEMRNIEAEIEKKKLFDKKHRKGVLELWYEVGKKLNFIDKMPLITNEDKKYIWRALYDHAGQLSPGKIGQRAIYRPENSHFKYCYVIASYPWNFVQKAGNWTAWVEFLDSRVIRDDTRIITWLGMIQKEHDCYMQDWLRALNRKIRNTFKNKITTVIPEELLFIKLNNIFNEIYPE